VESADEARRVAADLGGGTVVVKAQIHAGGRGKGTFRDARGNTVMRTDGSKPLGGVLVVSGPDAAAEVASRMLGNVLVTQQTGPEGRQVRRVLVEEGMQIAREVYLAALVDRSLGGPVCFVLSCMPRICPASVATSSGDLATLTPPPLPRPPAWIWALTTQIEPPSFCAASDASRTLKAG
jgi:hypothetical protein